jgi:hypothetical protein
MQSVARIADSLPKIVLNRGCSGAIYRHRTALARVARRFCSGQVALSERIESARRGRLPPDGWRQKIVAMLYLPVEKMSLNFNKVRSADQK